MITQYACAYTDPGKCLISYMLSSKRFTAIFLGTAAGFTLENAVQGNSLSFTDSRSYLAMCQAASMQCSSGGLAAA